MSFERALANQARPIMLEAKVKQLVVGEVSKGCLSDIAPVSVALEPAFQAIRCLDDLRAASIQPSWIREPPPRRDDMVRFEVWISPQQECKWKRSEMLVRQLAGLSHRAGLELVGNETGVSIQLLCHTSDVPVVTGAFEGTFPSCALSRRPSEPWRQVEDDESLGCVFFDYYPAPPYSHLMTRPDELPDSPYVTLLRAMASIPWSMLGLYQVVFQPVRPDHDWHHNVQVLQDLEYHVKRVSGLSPPQRHPQDVPSGDRHEMAEDIETKAHNDKPFYAAALRLAVFGASELSPHLLKSMACFSGLIQQGGRPLEVVDETAYEAALSRDKVREMFQLGMTYRPGFLVNSAELTSLVHLPRPDVIESSTVPMKLLERLSATDGLSSGCHIGDCNDAGTIKPVCIPDDVRFRHLHLIGRTGMGKSCVLEHLVLDVIGQGQGVAVLDPHRQMVEHLLECIAPQDASRVIYLDFSDRDWIPVFNPLVATNERHANRIADEVVGAFKGFIEGWGDRLEHLLKHAILGLQCLSRACLLDVSDALQPNSTMGKQLRDQVLQVVENKKIRRFWEEDLRTYKPMDLHPPQHKLSKLLTAEPLAAMLSQRETSFTLRQVMDEGRILIVDLSGLGTETRGILGCMLLGLLRAAAISRSDTAPENLRPFHIHIDEAHVFNSEAIQGIISETRKYRVSLTLAHHFLKQFPPRRVDALSSVGSTIIFSVDSHDAAHLRKDLQDKVSVKDIVGLEKWQAIARIGTEIVRFHTRPPHPALTPNSAEQIIACSHRRYYRHRSQVHPAPEATPVTRSSSGQAFARPVGGEQVKEFVYDVFA